jgi:hypothetical protein
MGISEVNTTVDVYKVQELLLWSVRRNLFHEIADKRNVTYSALGACLALNNGDEYLVKEAITRIKRRCVFDKSWIRDEEAFGVWVSKYA